MTKKQRYRIYFSKTEAMRFTSHLDLILTWERTFRRAGLPLAYSQGFSPRPVLNLAAPLPLGYTSQGEIGDFWLSAVVPAGDFLRLLEKALPPGLQVHLVEEIGDLHGSKLPALVAAATYRIALKRDFPNLEDTARELLQADSLPRERKKKRYDLRPLIQDLRVIINPPNPPEILTTLAALPGASGRPDEVLAALDIPPLDASICRTEIHLREAEGV